MAPFVVKIVSLFEKLNTNKKRAKAWPILNTTKEIIVSKFDKYYLHFDERRKQME